MDQKVTFAPDRTPTWGQLAELLAARKFPIQLRMIDGELAFPNEIPPDAWRELRAGTPHGMITLRREPDGITLVAWGNADSDMRKAWNALTWGIAHLTGGSLRTAAGSVTLAEFTQTAELPADLLT